MEKRVWSQLYWKLMFEIFFLSSKDNEEDISYVIESDEDLEMEMLKVCSTLWKITFSCFQETLIK